MHYEDKKNISIDYWSMSTAHFVFVINNTFEENFQTCTYNDGCFLLFGIMPFNSPTTQLDQTSSNLLTYTKISKIYYKR